MKMLSGMADTRAREGESMTDAPLVDSKCMAAPFAEPFAEAADSTADGSATAGASSTPESSDMTAEVLGRVGVWKKKSACKNQLWTPWKHDVSGK